VARNTIADYYRKNKKSAELTLPISEKADVSNTCLCDLSSFIIQTYIPKKYSEPLYLSDIEQKSQKEIAETLGLSLTATKSRIQRGRKKLKKIVSDYVEISYNNNGQITDFQLKKNNELPKELIDEIEKLNLIL
jgi:RNA polymerase sigma-70 factor (ECF subfamily)